MELRLTRTLTISYLALSLATVAAQVVLLLAAHPTSLVTWNSAFRTVIVAVGAVVLFSFTRLAAQGRPGWLTRLRIVLPIITVSFIVVLFTLPLPTWVVIEQLVCCALMAAASVSIFLHRRL